MSKVEIEQQVAYILRETHNAAIDKAVETIRVGKEAVRGKPEKDMAFWAFDWCEQEILALREN